MAGKTDYLSKFGAIYYLTYVRNLIQILNYPSQPTETLRYNTNNEVPNKLLQTPNKLERIVRKTPR